LFLMLCFSASASFDPVQVMCEINGYMIPAMIDTGAEITVMSSSCAKRCHISNNIDAKHAGKVIGVGSSEIIGGIDNLAFRIGPVNFQNKISILRNSPCDFLIGLDILRRFKCDISLGQNVVKLKVRKNTIRIPMVSRNPILRTAKQRQLSSVPAGQTAPQQPLTPDAVVATNMMKRRIEKSFSKSLGNESNNRGSGTGPTASKPTSAETLSSSLTQQQQQEEDEQEKLSVPVEELSGGYYSDYEEDNDISLDSDDDTVSMEGV
jgi:hypothetical protein